MIVQLPKLTIKSLMQRSFTEYAARPALAFFDERPITYAQVQANIQELSQRLKAIGLNKGDRVGLLGENSPNWTMAYLTITTMGLVVVPILPGFTENDTRHIIRHSGCKAIFISEKQHSKLEELEAYPLIIFSLEDFSIEDSAKTRPSLNDKSRTKSKAVPSEWPEATEDDLAAIIYTSGTTGNSKGVVLSHRNIVYDVVHSIERFPITHQDRFLSILPLSHAYETTGGMLCPMAVGVSIYYLKGMPTPQKLLTGMEMVKPTGVLTVPLVVDKIYRKRILPKMQKSSLMRKLYDMPFFRKQLHKMAGKKLLQSLGGSLRFFMFGGASLNLDVETFLQEAGISYSSGYGMTETSPIMTINPFGSVMVGSCGKPIPGIEMKIRNPHPETGIGEIIVAGQIVMQGYYNNPDATRETIGEDGWLKTGDLGYFDKEGYLFIKGRSKNVIVGPSGENIYPELIEQKLQQSPFVQEAVVYSHRGRLLAKVYLDPDALDQEMSSQQIEPAKSRPFIDSILDQTRKTTNHDLPAFSHLAQLIEQAEPFEKTPTNKVKRYLYIPLEE
jgi:long-chain acyl-CoA synthetase